MTYREKSGTELYADHGRDIVLKRHSAFGPWLVIGLMTVLTLFLAYLIYSNVIRPGTVLSSPDQPPSAPVPPWAPVATSVPQSRATHALVGGKGPAILPARLSVTSHARRKRRVVH